MTQTTALKKEERENPYKGIALPDNVREQTKQVSEISDLIAEYEKILENDEANDISFKTEKIYLKDESIEKTDFLKPEEIDNFLQRTILYENHKNYAITTGIFITKLIQESNFYGGFTEFNINTNNLTRSIERLGDTLVPRYDNITINILGDAGIKLGINSTRCEYNVKGSVREFCGAHSKKCSFNIEKDAGINTGFHSKFSRYVVKGNAHSSFGVNSKSCFFLLEGDADHYCGYSTTNCILDIRGNVGEVCGNMSEGSIFFIKGNAGKGLGHTSKESSYFVEQDADTDLSNFSHNCFYHIKGNVKDINCWDSESNFYLIEGDNHQKDVKKSSEFSDMKNNILLTPNKETFRSFKSYVPKNNNIILTDENYNMKKKRNKKRGLWLWQR